MSHQTLVIAHRGASGYLPEHTLATKALAHNMGAHYLEQDVVLTNDGVPIVLHDIYLDSTTDVAARFATKRRSDGHFHAIDFTLAEIRQLQVGERRVADGSAAVYPGRFPRALRLFSIATLAEEIEFIDGLNKSTGTHTGLYLELKSPNYHRHEGWDIAKQVIAVLQATGYHDRPEDIYLQCFDDLTLKQLKFEWRTPLPLIQLIADNSWGEDSVVDYDHLCTPSGLAAIAEYADGIGPWLSHIYLGKDDAGVHQCSPLVEQAHAAGLLVHPFTFRRDDLPAGIGSFSELLTLFIDQLGVDGLFTDFPDLAVQHIEALTQAR